MVPGHIPRRGLIGTWYPLRMGGIRIGLGMFLVLAAVAAVQQSQPIRSTNSEISEPKLPIVKEQPCLANGRVDRPIKRGSPIYSSWRDQRTQIGRLTARQKVTVLSGINITGCFGIAAFSANFAPDEASTSILHSRCLGAPEKRDDRKLALGGTFRGADLSGVG
jgi:hypothetical protein